MIERETIVEMSRAYREIEAAELLLQDLEGELKKKPDRVDARGNLVSARRRCQLGWPMSDSSVRLYDVEPETARVVIQAHIADQRAKLEKLSHIAVLQQPDGEPNGGNLATRYWYECQETAMAPGIADGWPEVIPAPHTPNGRLIRREYPSPGSSREA